MGITTVPVSQSCHKNGVNVCIAVRTVTGTVSRLLQILLKLVSVHSKHSVSISYSNKLTQMHKIPFGFSDLSNGIDVISTFSKKVNTVS